MPSRCLSRPKSETIKTGGDPSAVACRPRGDAGPPLRIGLYYNSVTQTPTLRLAPGGPTNEPAIGGTDSGNLATATAM